MLSLTVSTVDIDLHTFHSPFRVRTATDHRSEKHIRGSASTPVNVNGLALRIFAVSRGIKCVGKCFERGEAGQLPQPAATESAPVIQLRRDLSPSTLATYPMMKQSVQDTRCNRMIDE
jgi:hypothetical protein